MVTLDKYYPDWRALSIHESSPGEQGPSIKLRNECKRYISSQYLPDSASGESINGFRNDNLEKQTFGNETFDLVVTQDVFEHVYNPADAFKEVSRTLKKGGAHIFTTPLVNKFNPSEVWAKLGDNGKPVFLKTPEHHGNPVNAEGSPVTMHWGYDIVDFIKQSSGLETHIEYIDDLNYGIRAEYNEVLVSKKLVSDSLQ